MLPILNLEKLRSNLVCGFNLTCLGDNAPFSYVPTPYSNTYTDKVLSFFLTQLYPNHNIYSWLDRGSDERQYCSPHINLPVCTVTRSKFHVYPEYHTDLDNLNFVSSEGLYTSFDFFTQLILFLEANCSPIATYPCEPFLLKYGLSSSTSIKTVFNNKKDVLNFLSYCDGSNDLIDLCTLCKLSLESTLSIFYTLVDHDLIHI